jgi:hypothetical protein
MGQASRKRTGSSSQAYKQLLRGKITSKQYVKTLKSEARSSARRSAARSSARRSSARGSA